MQNTLLFGLQNGSLLCLNMTDTSPFPIWNVKNSESGISVLNICDFNKNGKSDILIGREDATL